MSIPPDPSFSSRVTPEPAKAEDFELAREPSLGKPIREVTYDASGKPVSVTWRFKVALGGKTHTGWVSGDHVTEDMSLKFNIASGEMKDPEREKIVALAAIKDMQSKFSYMEETEARAAFADIKDKKIRNMRILLCRETEKGPVAGICTTFTDKDGSVFMFFHEFANDKIHKFRFPSASPAYVDALIKQYFHTKRQMRDATWESWFKSSFGGGGVEGEGIVDFSAPAKRGSFTKQPLAHQHLTAQRAYTKLDRYKAMPYVDQSTPSSTPPDTPPPSSGGAVATASGRTMDPLAAAPGASTTALVAAGVGLTPGAST